MYIAQVFTESGRILDFLKKHLLETFKTINKFPGMFVVMYTDNRIC